MPKRSRPSRAGSCRSSSTSCEERIAELDAQLAEQAGRDETVQRLISVPGVTAHPSLIGSVGFAEPLGHERLFAQHEPEVDQCKEGGDDGERDEAAAGPRPAG